MASTLVITLKSARSQGDLARFLKDTSAPRNECRSLAHLFERLGAGLDAGSFDVQTSVSAPVRATATLTCAFASISNNDTVTIGGTVLTCVTGTPSGAQFKKVTDGPTTCANLVALIKANTTLNKYLTASTTTTGVGVVTLTALTPGAIGNLISLASSAVGFVASGALFTAGAGGSETVAVNFSRGL